MANFNFGDITQNAGDGGVNQIGENVANINAEDQSSADLDVLLQAIKDAVAGVQPVDQTLASPPQYTEIALPVDEPSLLEAPPAPVPDLILPEGLPSEHDDMMCQLEAIARMSEEEQKSEKNKGKIKQIVEYCKANGPAIAQNIAVFGSGALESIAKSNPIINGIYQVCKANQKSAQEDMFHEPFNPYSEPSFGSDDTFGAS